MESDIFIASKVAIHSGIYNCTDNRFFAIVTNFANEPTRIEVDEPLKAELNNFSLEEPTQDEVVKMNRTHIFDQLRLDHLNLEQKNNLLKVIADYENIFYVEEQQLTFTNAIKHKISTRDDVPIHTKSYRYPFCHREEVQRQISKMLDQGIIRPSSGPWTSPVWIVPKKLESSGKKKWRLPG